VDWNDLAQDREKWWDFMQTVLKLQVP